MKTLNEVAKLAQSGNTEALNQLLTLMRRRACAIAHKFYRFSQPNDIEDLAQDLLMHMFVKIGQWRGDSLFTTWAHQVFVNRALMEVRTGKNRPDRRHNYCVSAVSDMPSSADISEGLAFHIPSDDRDYHSQVHACTDILTLIRGLTPEHQAVIYLSRIEGFEAKEVANLLGITVGAAKGRLLHATNAMKAAAVKEEM